MEACVVGASSSSGYGILPGLLYWSLEDLRLYAPLEWRTLWCHHWNSRCTAKCK